MGKDGAFLNINLNSTFADVVEIYIDFFASSSSHTARAKKLDLNKFCAFIQKKLKKTPVTLADWDHSITERFIEELLLLGESPTTVRRRIATLKHFGRTIAERSQSIHNPAREVKSPRPTAPAPKGISETESTDVREIANRRVELKPSFNRRRNLLLFDFLVETGLRADEVRLLKFGQISEDFEWIMEVRTKGRRYRNVYLPSTIRDKFITYLEERKRELKKFYPSISDKIDKRLPVFISTYGASSEDPESFRMGAKSLWRAVRELSAETKLHPHLLRHSFAHTLLDSSKDIRLVSQALGHSDVRTTMKYTERQEAEIASAIEIMNENKSIKSPNKT